MLYSNDKWLNSILFKKLDHGGNNVSCLFLESVYDAICSGVSEKPFKLFILGDGGA